MPEQPEQDFIIPEKFLKELHEFSNGGFVLFTFSEHGRPVIHTYLETEKDRLAMENVIDMYAEKQASKRYAPSVSSDEDEGEED